MDENWKSSQSFKSELQELAQDIRQFDTPEVTVPLNTPIPSIPTPLISYAPPDSPNPITNKTATLKALIISKISELLVWVSEMLSAR